MDGRLEKMKISLEEFSSLWIDIKNADKYNYKYNEDGGVDIVIVRNDGRKKIIHPDITRG